MTIHAQLLAIAAKIPEPLATELRKIAIEVHRLERFADEIVSEAREDELARAHSVMPGQPPLVPLITVLNWS